MSQDIDFSQYRRKSSPQEKKDPLFEFNPNQQEDIDFSQFKRKPERSILEKGGRLAAQAGIATAERAALPYELGLAPIAGKEGQRVNYRQNLFGDIERLQEQKQTGVWDKKDEELLKNLIEQAKQPEKSEQFIKGHDIGVRGLAQKVTGLDLHPQGILEKAVSWTAFLKNPKNALPIIKSGIQPKDVIKAIMPGEKALRGLTAGYALEVAEQGQFGPLGTMGSAVVGDLMGHGIKGTAKALINPKQTLAKGTAMLANRKSVIKQELSEAAEGKNFTKDLGTLTDNNIIKMIQARLSASGLVGKPLDDLRKTMIKEVVSEYESIANELGEAKYATLSEAGEAGKEALTSIRDAEKNRISQLFERANERLNDQSVVNPVKLASAIQKIKRNLEPGSVKSTEQKSVLGIIENLEKDIYDAEGNLKPASVKNLMNNKIALNDIINYEIQGGQKQLLKGLVHDIDKLILSHGAKDQEFLKAYAQANKEFAKHAKDFRNENINKILLSRDPQTLLNKMNSIQGIRDLRQALSYSPEGKEIFNSLARKKMDMIFGDNFNEGLKDQLKFGKFSNPFKNAKNREILNELLPKDAYKRLVRLQTHIGEIQESAQKFFNASQSATSAADLTAMGSVLTGVYSLFSGNPWPILATGALIGGARSLSGLMGNAKFLQLVEESINAANKNDIGMMIRISKQAKPILQESGIASTLYEKDQSR